LGDSFTNGGGLKSENSYEETYTTQLYNLLLSDNRFKASIGNKKIEILPLSDGGLNTEQEYSLLRNLGIRYQPDIIILQYTDNDIGPKRTDLGFTEKGLYIAQRSNLLNIDGQLVPAIPHISNKLNLFLLRRSAFVRFISYKMNIAFYDNNFYLDSASSFSYIRKMDSITKEAKIPFIIIELPPASGTENYCSYKSGYGGTALHEKLKNLSIEIGADFYNLCNYVENIHSLKSEIEPEDGCHYGKEGYQIVAEVLKGALEKIVIKN
jgi:hypothetical protein